MKICVAVLCENYEKRLCWQLSSILQQEKKANSPEIVIDVAYLDRKFGKHLRTEEVLDTFPDLNIKRSKYYRDTATFERRGLVRNKQLKETDADWILFADCDMTYPPEFFNMLSKLLNTSVYKDSTNCLHSSRFSTVLTETNNLLAKYTYPSIIPLAHLNMSTLPGKRMRDIGAGYCQIANVSKIKNSEHPYYVPDTYNKDAAFLSNDKYTSYTPKSDIAFRKRLGAKKIPLPIQIHIQHERDADKHLTHLR